jgi:hypothetical protein
MANDVEVAIVGPDFEEGMIGAVPSIDHLLDLVFVIVQLKAKWSLVGLATGITLNVEPHGPIFAQNRPVKRCPFCLPFSGNTVARLLVVRIPRLGPVLFIASSLVIDNQVGKRLGNRESLISYPLLQEAT